MTVESAPVPGTIIPIVTTSGRTSTDQCFLLPRFREIPVLQLPVVLYLKRSSHKSDILHCQCLNWLHTAPIIPSSNNYPGSDSSVVYCFVTVFLSNLVTLVDSASQEQHRNTSSVCFDVVVMSICSNKKSRFRSLQLRQ